MWSSSALACLIFNPFLSHILTYAIDIYDSQEKLDLLEEHGWQWQMMVRKSIRLPEIRKEAIKTIGMTPRCLYKKRKRCLWCRKKNRKPGSILRFSDCTVSDDDSIISF